MMSTLPYRLSAFACVWAAAAVHAAPPADPQRFAAPQAEPALALAPAPSPLAQRLRGRASVLVLASMDFLGVPYRRGGTSAEDGFDCSGFTRHVFERTVGLVLPRRADEQARDASLVAVARDQLKPGDLVFFNTLRRAFSHVGIYVGDGRFIHAPRSGSQVRIDDLRQAYWSRRFDGARRAGGRFVSLLPSAMAADAALPASAGPPAAVAPDALAAPVAAVAAAASVAPGARP